MHECASDLGLTLRWHSELALVEIDLRSLSSFALTIEVVLLSSGGSYFAIDGFRKEWVDC